MIQSWPGLHVIRFFQENLKNRLDFSGMHAMLIGVGGNGSRHQYRSGIWLLAVR